MTDVISRNDLMPQNIPGTSVDVVTEYGMLWEVIKTPIIVPLLQFAVYICLAMTVMLFMERLYMGVVIILIKLFWKKPEQRYKYQPIREDMEIGNMSFPKVLIQIPMFNEKEVSIRVEFLEFYIVLYLLLLCFVQPFEFKIECVGIQDLNWGSL